MPPVAEHGLEFTFLRHLPLTEAAVAWAVERHAGQRREADGAAFVIHPIEVAMLVDNAHYPDFVVAAAVLHDLLEKTGVTVAEIEERYGAEVAELVLVVSDDPALTDEDERKRDLLERVRRAGGYAAAVYAADKVSKMREIRMALAAGDAPDRFAVKIRRHRESLAMLEEATPGGPLVELLRFELETFDELPPTGHVA